MAVHNPEQRKKKLYYLFFKLICASSRNMICFLYVGMGIRVNCRLFFSENMVSQFGQNKCQSDT